LWIIIDRSLLFNILFMMSHRIKIILFAAILLLTGCSGEIGLNSDQRLRGQWYAEFVGTYFSMTVTPEGGENQYTLNHESRLGFSDGYFEVFIEPPVPPLFGNGESYSCFSCLYSISGDTLIFSDQSTGDEIERYSFNVSGDTLSLSYLPLVIAEGDGETIAAVPLYGGLPWGRSRMWHAGEFFRLPHTAE